MKTAEAIWLCLPEGMDELFDMVRFERTDNAYDIWLLFSSCVTKIAKLPSDIPLIFR